MKLSAKEKDQVMSTSKAQSIVSSRKSSRRSSLDADETPIKQVIDPETKAKCVQFSEKQKADCEKIENIPSLFA